MNYVVEVVELRYFKRFMSAVLESLPDHGKQRVSSFVITGTTREDVYCILVTIFNNGPIIIIIDGLLTYFRTER